MATLIQAPAKTQAATRPEIELILCCARTRIDSATAERIKSLLQQNIDWVYLIQTAAYHGVMPLLYWSLNSIGSEAVPKTILSQLRNHFHSNAQRNLFLTSELLKLLNLFEFHSIPAIPFKGPVLAISAYGNLSFRQISDLDILVQERDYQRAKELLLNQGHRMLCDSKHEASCLQAQLWHEEKQISIDLHYGIPPQHLRLNSDIFRENLQLLSLAGTSIQTFSPETHLLILSVERDKDDWNWFSKIYDMAAIIRSHPQINWQSLTEQARKLKLERTLDLSLVLAKTLLAAPVPAEVLSRIEKAPPIGWQANLLSQNPFSEKDYHHPWHLWANALYRLSVSEGQWHRLFHWLTPNPADQAFIVLPRSLHFLYYLIRPIRLVGKYVLSLLQALFKLLYKKNGQ